MMRMITVVAAGLLLAACHSLSLPPSQATVPEGVYFPERHIDEAQRGATFYFTPETDGARVYGSGPHRYRMVLLHPHWHNRVMPRQPYALSHSGIDLPFVADEKDVFQGVTDRFGRTDIFAFATPVARHGWNLRQRTGQGPYGEQFVMHDQHDAPLQGMAYVLQVCTPRPYIYRGHTDALGQTAFVATQAATDIHVYADHDPVSPNCPPPANR